MIARPDRSRSLVALAPSTSSLARRAGPRRSWPTGRRALRALVGRRPLATGRLRRMPTSLVTGGAGFLGSHLCDRLLAEGHRVLCVDNLDTGTLENIEHIRDPAFLLPPARHDRAPRDRRAGGLRLPPGVAGEPDRLPAAAAAHAEGRLLRHPQRPRPGQAPPGALPAGLHQRGLRRPAGAPPERGLLGPRQPDRPAGRVRRGQALRRGPHDGLPPPAGRGHAHRPHLQHLRAADAPPRRARDPDLHAPGARATSRSRCSARASRRARSATSRT